ncbi:MAG: family 78 glycoside hydrolase catalytic domain, partial [Muribaculaceae bacterium]|nr:family 78 glycoside hydrolase catalytic domain [Muribaculaceae bacterium]
MNNTNIFRSLISVFFFIFSSIPLFATGRTIDSIDSEGWGCSEWISAKDAPVITGTVAWSQRSADGASWFVSEMVNEKQIASAKWMTTALGVYDIFVNGELIGEEVLKPGFTDYEKTKYSFTYDITESLNLGEGAVNILSAQVTSGWWADRVITPSGNKGTIGKKCAFRGVLEVTFVDGSTKLYGTNLDHWKAGIAGKVKHAGIYDGEVYDNREREGFDCYESLAIPELNTEFNGEILPTGGAEIYLRHDLTLAPKLAYVYRDIDGASEDDYGKVNICRTYADNEIMTLQPGETLVVDFGQNCSAVPHFVFKAKEGTILRCLPGEILNDGNGAKERGMDGPEGSVHRKNLRIPEKGMYIEYIFGEGEDFVQYTPHYSYFGYRYVAVTADDEVEISRISSIPISSITENMEVGHITTGNALINQLLSNTLWSQRSNYLSVPTDCPNRNERLGWLADTQIFCETGSYFADVQKFFHKWMRDVSDSQFESGA